MTLKNCYLSFWLELHLKKKKEELLNGARDISQSVRCLPQNHPHKNPSMVAHICMPTAGKVETSPSGMPGTDGPASLALWVWVHASGRSCHKKTCLLMHAYTCVLHIHVPAHTCTHNTKKMDFCLQDRTEIPTIYEMALSISKSKYQSILENATDGPVSWISGYMDLLCKPGSLSSVSDAVGEGENQLLRAVL